MRDNCTFVNKSFKKVSNFSHLEQLLSKVFRADSENPEHPERFSRTKFEFCARSLEKEKKVSRIPLRHSYSINKHSEDSRLAK